MDSKKRFFRFFIWFAVALLQVISTQVVTFLLSLLLPGMENFPHEQPALFVFLVGPTFATGAFLAGWLAVRLRWLHVRPLLLARAVSALVCAYLPLILALVIYRTLAPGNPFFLVSVLMSVLGFHLPGWLSTNNAVSPA